MKTLALLLSTVALTLAQSPAEKPPEMPKPDLSKDVEDLFRTAEEALADKDPAGFLEKFDSKMPGYAMLRDEIIELLSRSDVSSDVEVFADSGDNQKRSVDLDWTLQIDEEQPRRKIVKFRIERQGKKWKIVSLEPVDFFKPAALP